MQKEASVAPVKNIANIIRELIHVESQMQRAEAENNDNEYRRLLARYNEITSLKRKRDVYKGYLYLNTVYYLFII